MKAPVLICETSLQLGPCDFGGRHEVRILVQVHWDLIREGFLLRNGTSTEVFEPTLWQGFVDKARHFAELWIGDSYVHQVMWWSGGNRLPAGWYSLYFFPAGARRVLLGIAGYLGTGEGPFVCVGSTCFCEGSWWQQRGDYLNYLFELGPHGERHAA